MKHETLKTTNLRALIRAQEAILSRPKGKPGMVIVHGPAGFGKTLGTLWMANEYNGINLEANPLWTPRWMLADLVKALGALPPYSTQARYEFIVHALREDPRPIFIDEADRIAKSEVQSETLRAVHDGTGAPIILIGMDQFKRRAMSRPQLHRRIVREVEFKPATIEDARMLARDLCDKAEIYDDLVVELHRRSHGSIGILCNMLADAESSAKRNGVKILKLADYEKAA